MIVTGERAIARFAKKYAAARKPLARFLEITRAANWQHLPALKRTFPNADYTAESGVVIFEIGGNKYRLIASVDFEEQILDVQAVMTHEDYDRERF